MPITATCPSCGAPVRFQSAASALAVCGYCRSTLARDGDTLKNLGRMAELLPDQSPLQIGSQGRWRGVAFSVIGRLQLRYEAGFWNEWHILLDDGRSGWISDASGQWTATLPAEAPADLPAFESLAPGQRITIGRRSFEVTDKQEAVCLSGEGELPFVVGAGYIAPVVDLRNESLFASLDYSESPPRAYVGEALDPATLSLSNLRDRAREALVAAPTTKARQLACPSCGSPWNLHDTQILAMACPACGTLSDIDGEIAKVRDAARRGNVIKPTLPLGSRGKLAAFGLGDKSWEIIGFMRRAVSDSPSDSWDEYLLNDGEGGFAWLVSERDHWNLVRQENRQPVQVSAGDRPAYTLGSERYTHFASYEAKVVAVLGEFTWKVRVDERCECADFIAPPRILSSETTQSERTWSAGQYLPHTELMAAFGIKQLRAPRGVNACQPNPHSARRLPLTLALVVFAVLAFGLHSYFDSGPAQPLFNTRMDLSAGQESALTSEPFTIVSDQKRIELENLVPVSNSWADTDVELVNTETGVSYAASSEIGYYYGTDSDGSWSEGSQSAKATFLDVPAGQYLLSVRSELAADNTQGVMTQHIALRTAPPPFSNLVLCLIFLAIYPAWIWLRANSFETARWAESDHPRTSSSDEDDD